VLDNRIMQHRQALGTLLLLVISGCQSVRLPAIDPSGESFLLTDRSTTVILPDVGRLDRWSCLPKPAFSQPRAVPPCGTDPPPPGSVLFADECFDGRLKNKYEDPIKNGTLHVDPEQTVARVGSEVVLRAGLCGSDGYLVTKQPIEWTLSQESKGHIVSVGDPSCSFLPAALRGARKFSGNYAVGRTSSRHETVTRGTAVRRDDLDVAKGQNWVSITSPEAGVSHITVWAPKAENWDRRRSTVTIHWVDAEWQFPPSVVAADGQPIRLVTKVRRRSGVGAESMRVRYVIEDDRARFVGGGYEREVPVSASGEAAVEIEQATDQGGTVRVNVTLIRPATSSSDLPNMILSKGVTTVTWTAPALDLKFTAGPQMANREGSTIYRFEVHNPGKMAITNAVVDLRVPDGMRFVMATPPPTANVEPNVRWNLGDLAASAVVQIEVELQAPNSNVSVRICADARCDEGLVATDCYDTEIFTSNLQLEVRHDPTVVQGQVIEFSIDVTNTGPIALNGVTLTAIYDDGLQHKFGKKNDRAVQSLTPNGGRIEAGQTVPLPLRFNALVIGRQCVAIEVIDQTKTDRVSQKYCVDVQPPSAPPANADIQVRITGPNQLIVGDAEFYKITVTNPTNVPLTGVKVIQRVPQEMALVASNPNANEAQLGTFEWSVGRLEPRESVAIDTRLRAIAASPGALVEVSVQSNEREEDHDSIKTRIVAAQVEPERQPDDPAPANPDGADRGPASIGENGLRVSIDRLNVFAAVGEAVVFIVRIENRGDRPDRDVELKVTLPDRVPVVSAPASASRPRNGIIRFEPIRTLRAGEKNVEFRIEVRPKVPGELKIDAAVTSWRQKKPLVANQTVSVINRD